MIHSQTLRASHTVLSTHTLDNMRSQTFLCGLGRERQFHSQSLRGVYEEIISGPSTEK